MSSPSYTVLPCPLSEGVPPVFVQVVSPPLGWSPVSSFLKMWLGLHVSGDTRGPSIVIEAVVQDRFICVTLLIMSTTCVLPPVLPPFLSPRLPLSLSGKSSRKATTIYPRLEEMMKLKKIDVMSSNTSEKVALCALTTRVRITTN